jgi:hypothetical protein
VTYFRILFRNFSWTDRRRLLVILRIDVVGSKFKPETPDYKRIKCLPGSACPVETTRLALIRHNDLDRRDSVL